MSKAWLVLTLCIFVLGSGFAHSAGFLTGSIEQTVYSQNQSTLSQVQGVIYNEKTGRPVAGARVRLPDLGYEVYTRADGSFEFNGLAMASLRHKRLIMSIEKSGFMPNNAIMDVDSMAQEPMKIGIKESQQVIVIDQALHHLGDNNYSPYSSAAGQFSHRSEGVVLRRQFVLNQGNRPSLNKKTELLIGAVLGLDTLRAHQAGQSTIPYASSPMIVRLNGQAIAYITLNGVRQHIVLPQGLLNFSGSNILEIKTGYHRPDGVRIDYDDLELMNLILLL